MAVSIIVETIRAQLFASGATKVWSWGAHAWIGLPKLRPGATSVLTAQ